QRIEALVSHEHERKLELQKEANRAERVQQLLNVAWALAPAVVNRITGKKLLKEPEGSPIKGLVRTLQRSITEEQKAQIIGVLRPIQTALLSELFKASEEPDDPTSGTAMVPSGAGQTGGPPASPAAPKDGSSP